MRKHFANLAVGQTLYRRAGSGQPVVLLHASPMSSSVMEPTINALSGTADVIAPDTPGYGWSDALPESVLSSSDNLSPYVEWLRAFLDDLGLDRVGLYGSATGAQIAIEFARSYPERLAFLILDNAAHFTDQERARIMRDYFPSIAPNNSGGHLQTAWEMARGVVQWFPWYQQDDEHRISELEPSPELVHNIAMAYLTAGEGYAQAYRRAFANEDARRAQEINVPTRVIRWQGSPIKQFVDRYDDFDWPSNFKMCPCGDTLDERFTTLQTVVAEFYG